MRVLFRCWLVGERAEALGLLDGIADLVEIAAPFARAFETSQPRLSGRALGDQELGNLQRPRGVAVKGQRRERDDARAGRSVVTNDLVTLQGRRGVGG